MVNPHEEIDAVKESEDGNLTIRIPNPKVYLARQSLWIGRRGKPRCDHCRANNLKCDRILPACNHCSWTPGRVCKYTPLPTPAHRGIPRCDRCRLENLKCDRNLPICNHCNHDQITNCNYTPKKRHKTQYAPTVNLKAADVNHKICGVELPTDLTERTDGTKQPQAISPPLASSNMTSKISYTHTVQPVPQAFSHSRIIPIEFQVEPWTHPSFAPLPDFISRRLGMLNLIEIPDRHTFEQSLTSFLDGLMEAYRETACLTPNMYAAVSRFLSKHETSKLAATVRDWVAIHHLCSGSEELNLILAPREVMFRVENSTLETRRLEYCARAMGTQVRHLGPSERPDFLPPNQHAVVASVAHEVFDRLPVRTQIYDILAYAHASHNNPYTMVQVIKQLGFTGVTWPMAELYVQLCPVCAPTRLQST